MKKTKTCTIVILIGLIVFGIFSLLSDADNGEKEEYQTAMDQAADYMERGLYQMAIIEYEKAAAIEDSEELRNSILNAYEKRYRESAGILSSYITAAESAVAAYSDHADYYIILAKVYMRSDNYQAAYKVLDNAIASGVTDHEMEELYDDVKYAFELDWYTYNGFLPLTNGTYPVMNSERWGYIDATGSSTVDFDYSFVSQVGEEGIRILAGEQVLLMDQNDIVRGKLSFIPVQAGTYSEGLIAVHNGESYGYYDSVGDFVFGEYIAASNFQNGKAAVQLKDEQWAVIDSGGNKVSDQIYQDIRLNPDGTYLCDQMMIAKKDGKYRFFDADGNPDGTFECDNMDVMTDDGLIAFESDGKWGFVDADGEVVIRPQFDKAKSFSNGMAAVCVDEKWGFVDVTGKIVIECQFYDADYFNGESSCLVKTTPDDWQMISLRVEF